MRALDRLLETEAEETPPAEDWAGRTSVYVRSMEDESGRGMQVSTHYPPRHKLLAMLSKSERAILRKQAKKG